MQSLLMLVLLLLQNPAAPTYMVSGRVTKFPDATNAPSMVILRSFALKEAPGQGQRTTVRPDGTFAVDETKMAAAVTALTRDIMTLQAEGSYSKARDLIDRLGVIRPQVQKVLDRLTSVPVDIEPKFVTADTLR